MNKLKKIVTGNDWLLYFMCVFTSAFGCLMVYSATKNSAEAAGSLFSHDFLINAAASVLGMIICVIISYFDYNSIIRVFPIVGGICLALILALFVWGVGPIDRPDAVCWLPIIKTGSFTLNFQPSELAKIGFLVTFSAHVDAVKHDINKLKNVILLTFHALIPIGLIILTDDLGTAIVFGFMFVGMMFAAGLKLRYFAIAIGAFVAASPLIWTKFLSSFHRQRILAIYYPDALSKTVLRNTIYQQQRAVTAIGSGGFFGDGLFKGTLTQSPDGVPVNESDMVFSVVGEELGFIGAFGLVLLLALICIRIMYIGRKSANLPGAILCYGCAFMIASQTILNIGMCLKMIPCIGITLPFVSAGGSSSLCIYFGIGLAMGVYRFNKYRPAGNFRYDGISTPFSD